MFFFPLFCFFILFIWFLSCLAFCFKFVFFRLRRGSQKVFQFQSCLSNSVLYKFGWFEQWVSLWVQNYDVCILNYSVYATGLYDPYESCAEVPDITRAAIQEWLETFDSNKILWHCDRNLFLHRQQTRKHRLEMYLTTNRGILFFCLSFFSVFLNQFSYITFLYFFIIPVTQALESFVWSKNSISCLQFSLIFNVNLILRRYRYYIFINDENLIKLLRNYYLDNIMFRVYFCYIPFSCESMVSNGNLSLDCGEYFKSEWAFKICFKILMYDL